MNKKQLYVILPFIIVSFSSVGQGQLSGDLMLNSNFYDHDSSIGATTTQYLHEMSSTESWLYLNYQISGFSFSARYDLFNNSPLLDPQEAYTRQGIGLYSISKTIDKLTITAGTFYDQFGSGITFRAYEDRLIGLDYAIRGIHLKYNFSDNFFIKGFTGQQKNRFDVYAPVLKGLNVEKSFNFKDKLQLIPGGTFVNRTLDENTMKVLADEIRSYSYTERFIPKYNLYAYSVYNSLTYKNINWYVEVAGKSEEAVKSRDGSKFELKPGSVIFTDLSYSRKGFGLSLQYKRTQTFSMRVSPFNTFNEGIINYMPPMSKQTSKTLPARYNIAARDYFEEAYHAELTWTLKKKNTFNADFTLVIDDEKGQIFREYYLDYYRKFSNKFKATL